MVRTTTNTKRVLPKKYKIFQVYEFWLINKMISSNVTMETKDIFIGSNDDMLARQEEFERVYDEEIIKYDKFIEEQNKYKQNKKTIKETGTGGTNANKGTGAGGKNTNLNGKKWESVTCNESNLIVDGFVRVLGYLTKKYENHEIVYFSQRELKKYFRQMHKLETHRVPDEAYLIKKNDGTFVLKVLEKKYQNCEGSVMEKLAGYSTIITEYKDMLKTLNIKISYAFCLSPYFKTLLCGERVKPKFVSWNGCFARDNVGIFYGEDTEYFNKLNSWINEF